jgi:hypothetical protein
MKTDSITEERIAAKAVSALHAKSGLHLELLDKNSVLGTGLWPDMRFRIAGSKLELVCEIKTGLCANMLEHTVKLLRTAVEGRPPMIMANYIDPKMASALRQLGVNYADASGNAYINLAPYFVFIEGQIIAGGLSQTRPEKPFSSTYLQVIYALLTNSDLLNQHYRQVSQRANVALGVCGSVLRELKDQGYFVEAVATKKREWRAKHKLIGRWVEQYPMLIKRSFVGEFSITNADWMQADGLHHFDAQFGGKAAAMRYAQTEVGGELSVYVDDQQQWQFIREMGLVKVAQDSTHSATSKVKVFSKFWGANSVTNKIDEVSPTVSLVHPLMAYAELIQIGDHHSCNAANKIASKYFV